MVIETERLILRPFKEGDEIDVFEYLEEPAVNCFIDMKLDSITEAREEVIKRSSQTEYYFAIMLKESGKVIGEINAYPEPADEHGTDSEMDTFSPCWMLTTNIKVKAMPMRLHKPSLTTFLRRGEQGAYMPTLKITILPASTFVKNLG